MLAFIGVGLSVSFEHVKLFKDVAQTGNMSRGARLNGISQSAASQHIQELEKELEVTLFDRTRRPMQLTEAGKLYNDLCRELLRKREEFHAALEQLRSEVTGMVRLATIYSVGLSEMSRIEEEYVLRYPQAKLEVEYLRPERVYAAVQNDEADLGIVSYPEGTRDLAVLPWREEEMVVAAPGSHPMAKLVEAKPSDLEDQDFIAFDLELPIRREVDRYLREQGVAVNVTMHFDAIPMIKEALAIGSGISILPRRMMLAEIEQGRLVAVPLVSPGLVRPLGIVYRRRKQFSRAAKAFLEMIERRDQEPV